MTLIKHRPEQNYRSDIRKRNDLLNFETVRCGAY